MTGNPSRMGPAAPTLTIDGFSFRDLNKNGRLDPYEDSRRPIDDRVEDLLSQMTLEEKAGMMFHTMIGMNKDGSLMEETGGFNPNRTSDLVARRLINHFNVYEVADPRHMAEWYNRLQKLAERTRLGIPVTISSDPRHAFTQNPATSMMAGEFSKWPEPIGLAATGDPALVEEFGDIARQEYVAVGIRTALHPMADMATEPRWARINGTFGEDAALASQMVSAYIKGFQGDELGPESVACMTKHFPGGGPQKDGEDAHFSYGREQVYPGGNFDYHLIPFEAALEAGTTQIMPYYGMPVGLPIEEVGFGFNKDVITGLLREKYGFDGVVCTDWMLLTPVTESGRELIEAKCWGVEDLTVEERARKAIDAGVDQFGGEACPEVIVGLVQSGQIDEARIDASVRRLLRDKFRFGLFDNPYVDPEAAAKIVGNDAFQKAGDIAQRKSIVLLKNTETPAGMALPIRGNPRIYVENMDPETASDYGQVVEDVGDADVAILRLNAPYEPREGFLERHFHAGDLAFKEEEKARILDILESVPTIVDIYLERPAVIPEIADKCAGLVANFGASDAAVLDVIFGHFSPSGKLPFEMPSSVEAVRGQKEDLPYDSTGPLFPFGYGLTYQDTPSVSRHAIGVSLLAPGSSLMDHVIPQPVSVKATGGTFVLTAATDIYVEPGTAELMSIGQHLADKLAPATGHRIRVLETTGPPPANGHIYLTTAGGDPALGEEGYELTVGQDLVALIAHQPTGLFRGLQTIRQLLPPSIENSTVQPGPWKIATGTIRDYPRFAWRGAMLDVARHFFMVDDVKRTIDLMAYYKLNCFHMHLSDDQGWRLAINSWPKLATYGGSTQVGGGSGGYYTQVEYSEIVAYAQSRYITIVPEIDMPGHTNAALASYAELNRDGKAPPLHTGTEVGFSSLCIDKEITFAFVEDVIREIAALTPGPYLHVGGDETHATSAVDYVQFIDRVQTIVQAHGKQTVGWEEIAQSDLLPTSVAQHWHSDLARKAAQQGAKVIMSPASRAFLDMKYDPSTPLGLNWAGYVDVKEAYTWDPATQVSGVSESDVLGVEAPLWSETLQTIADVEFMAFPRLPGSAEIGWSPETGRNWDEYRIRLAAHGPRLTAMGVNFYRSPLVPWP